LRKAAATGFLPVASRRLGSAQPPIQLQALDGNLPEHTGNGDGFSGPVGQSLPHPGHDDIAEKEINTEKMDAESPRQLA
jgi:hypothetical protein